MERKNFIIAGLSISVLFLVILLFFFGRWILNETNRWLTGDAENFASAVFNSLIESIRVPWETGDDMGLNSIIYRIKRENREIEEISVIGIDDIIIAHTNPENILSRFTLPEEAPFDLKSYGLKIIKDKVFILRPTLSTLGDTLGYVYMSLNPLSLREGKDTLRRILFLFVVALSALFLFLSAILIYISTPEEKMASVQSPKFSDFISSLIPQSGGYRPENWLLYSFFEKGEVPNIFYKIFRISPERWGVLSFQVIGGGYNWSILFPFINSYLDKFLFTEGDPFVILKGLIEEFSKISLKEGVVEGSLLFFEEKENKIKGASLGEHIFYRKKEEELLPLYEPSRFYDFSNKRGEVKYFEGPFDDSFFLITGNLYRWDKFNDIIQRIKQVRTEEDIKRIVENFRFLYEQSKMKEGVLAIFFKKTKEVEE